MKLLKKILGPVLILWVLTGLVFSCNNKDRDKEDNFINNYILYNYFNSSDSNSSYIISGMVVDASTGSPISLGTGSLVLTVSGEDKDLVVDSNGNPVDGTKYSSSIFDLKLKSGVTPTSSNPVEFLVVASIDGYISGGTSVTMGDPRDASVEIRLVSIDSAPQGVVASQKSIGSATDGSIGNSDVDVEFPEEPLTGAHVNVKIPAGTRLKDSSGNSLSGQLTATMAYFNPKNDTSIASFPGGLNVTATDESGETSSGVFSTAGFMAFEIADESGKKASDFSNNMTMTMQVPVGTPHPLTGEELAQGDTIPVWSYNETTGEWSSEGEGTVGAATDGLFEISFTTNHLSYYNLDWKDEKCSLSRTFVVTGNPNELPLDVELKAQSGTGFYRFMKSGNMHGDVNELSFYNAPENIPMTITLYSDGDAVGTLDVDSLCDGGETEIAAEIQTVERVDVPLSVSYVCEAEGVDDSHLTGYVNYRSSECSGVTCSYKYGGQYTDGSLTLENLKKDISYDLIVVAKHSSYETRVISSSLTASSGGASIEEDICDLFVEDGDGTGTATDTETNKDLECGKPYVLNDKEGFTLVYTQFYTNPFTAPVGDCNPASMSSSSSDLIFSYNSDDMVESITDSSAESDYTFTYNSSGYLTEFGNSNGNTISLSYDSIGRLVNVESQDPENKTQYVLVYSDSTAPFPVTEMYTIYNENGDVSSTFTLAIDNVTSNASGNLTSYSITNEDGTISSSDVTLAYNSAGDLVEYTFAYDDGGVSTNLYTYNSDGKVTEYISQSDSYTDTVSYEYDSEGRMSSVTTAGGTTYTMDYSTKSASFARALSEERAYKRAILPVERPLSLERAIPFFPVPNLRKR